MTDKNHPTEADVAKGYGSGKTPPEKLPAPRDAGAAGASQQHQPAPDSSQDKQ
jgi:hypothetical protein